MTESAAYRRYVRLVNDKPIVDRKAPRKLRRQLERLVRRQQGSEDLPGHRRPGSMNPRKN